MAKDVKGGLERGLAARLIAAAKDGTLGQFPAEHLRPEVLMAARDDDGKTPLHWAAQHGRLAEFPDAAKTPEAFLVRDTNGQTPLHMAASWRLENVPDACKTPEAFLVADATGHTPLHAAAQEDSLGDVPVAAKTPAAMLARDDHGMTPLHLSAYCGGLADVPAEAKGPEAMMAKDYMGRTPLHTAILGLADRIRLSCGRPLDPGRALCEQIPETSITPDALLAQDTDHRSPLWIAAEHGLLGHIPYMDPERIPRGLKIPAEVLVGWRERGPEPPSVGL